MKVYASYFVITFVLLASEGGQQLYGQTTGELSGIVKNKVTGQAIGGISVCVAGNKVQTKTDESGIFVLVDLPFGQYAIQFSGIGYETQSLAAVLAVADESTVDLGEIFLKPLLNELEEVVVSSEPPMVEFGDDTITFNASQSMMAEGSVASDILKSVPMVDVDIDGKPTVAGKLNTRIFINGKPADFTVETMADLLNVLPADMIAKVEVVTNPDVRYAADGDAIINIVLKKNFKLGLTGSVSLTAGTIDNYNGSTYVAYRDDSLSVNAGYGYKYGSRLSETASFRSNYRAVETEIPHSFIDQVSDGRNNQQGHNVNASLDWDLTPKQNITIMANMNKTTQTAWSGLDAYRLNADRAQQELRSQWNNSGIRGLSYKMDASYTAKFGGRKGSLETSIIAFGNGRQQDRYILREVERANGGMVDPFNQYMGNAIGNNRVEMSLDYRRPVTKMSTISLGVHGAFAENGNSQSVTGYDHRRGVDTVNKLLSDRFIYRESIYAIYASYQIRTNRKWSFRGGMRAESTHLALAESVGERMDVRPYFNFFPNLSLNKVIAKKHRLGLNYSMRLMRPRGYMLNPLINDANPANVSFGNPRLAPAYTHQYQLNYGIAGQKWSFNPRLTYATTGDIIRHFRVSADSVTYLNLASRNNWTLNLVGNYRRGKIVTLNGGCMLTMVHHHVPSTHGQYRRGWSRRANIGASFAFPKRISAEARAIYSDQALSQGNRRGTATVDLGVRKVFLNNKLSVRLMATDPFTNRNTLEFIDGTTVSEATYFQEVDRVFRTRNYRVSMSYRFTNAGSNKGVINNR